MTLLLSSFYIPMFLFAAGETESVSVLWPRPIHQNLLPQSKPTKYERPWFFTGGIKSDD